MKKRKLLFLAPFPSPESGGRYRVCQFIPYLEALGYQCTFRPFANLALADAIRNNGTVAKKALLAAYCSIRRALDLTTLSNYDLIFIHREAFPFLHPAIENFILSRHSNVVFSLDDALYAGHQDVQGHKYSSIYKFKFGAWVDSVLKRSTHVIAGCQELAEHTAQLNTNVTIIPTVVDVDLYCYKPVQPQARKLTIGWYGSTSTSPYLKAIAPALQRLEDAHKGRVSFRFYGDANISLGLSELEAFPYQFNSEVENLRTFDIGIMPLPDNVWTRGKCAFKAIQYMALGIPTVASPVGMVNELIQHNQNGLLAATNDEWFDALDRLIQDLALRQQLAAAARVTIVDGYSLQVWGPRLASLLHSIVEVESAVRNPGYMPANP